ncbi:hypothetical protein, partial [Paraburkholderia sp. BR14264]|uniref:hypothetical protein n=1 Tax=Paraburkholderia sp. BR14264 TaxID=3237001 RepID=UPI0039794C28
IEDAAASFYDAEDARAALLAQLNEIDQTRGLAVATLAELKESNQRIAQLLEIPAAEVRRLRELVDQADTPTVAAVPAPTEDAESTPDDSAPPGDAESAPEEPAYAQIA